MKLSVIIPWFDSGDVWRVRSVRWLLERYTQLLPDAEVVLGGQDSTGPFNRSAARNQAVERSTGEVLLIADADTIFQKPQIESACAMLLAGAPWVIPYELGRYYNLSSEETSLIWKCPPSSGVPEPTQPTQWEHKLNSHAGLLVMSREAFDKAGGYDERFDGWGFEDDAFRAALDRHVGPHRHLDGYVLHLWHPSHNDDTFGQPHIAANRDLYRRYEAGELP